MTPEQAREYATRIRLGEGLYYRGSPQALLVLGDGTVICTDLAHRYSSIFERPDQGWGLAHGVYKVPAPDPKDDTAIALNVKAALHLLDELANAP
jgi:hypothetical protein